MSLEGYFVIDFSSTSSPSLSLARNYWIGISLYFIVFFKLLLMNLIFFFGSEIYRYFLSGVLSLLVKNRWRPFGSI